jgi:chromosome segregation ATPase
MIEKKVERIDQEIKSLKTQIDFGGPEIRNLCQTLEHVLRDLKAFDQKRHQTDMMQKDMNKRFEAIVLSLEKMTKIMKDNGLI